MAFGNQPFSQLETSVYIQEGPRIRSAHIFSIPSVPIWGASFRLFPFPRSRICRRPVTPSGKPWRSSVFVGAVKRSQMSTWQLTLVRDWLPCVYYYYIYMCVCTYIYTHTYIYIYKCINVYALSRFIGGSMGLLWSTYMVYWGLWIHPFYGNPTVNPQEKLGNPLIYPRTKAEFTQK